MANTLTNLIPDFYEALDIVSREITGFLGAVNTDNRIERAALNQDVVVPVTQAQASADNTPGQEVPDTGDQEIDNVKVTISKSKHVPIRWNGEQTKAYKSNGLFSSTLAQQSAQGIRTLVNEMEADIAAEYLRTSRAYGVAGTTPFASDLSAAANAKKILDDNGAPMSDRSMVIDTTAGVNLRTLANLNQTNQAGTDQTLRRGVLLPLFGMDIRESAQVAQHIAGTGALATTDTAGYAVGATVITLASAGTGTIVPGDVISFAGDPNKYLVVVGDTDVSDGGSITIAAPGLRQALPASAVAITLAANYTANMAFQRNAIQFANRQVAMPEGGDKAIDSTIIIDPQTGLAFEFALYPGYLRNTIHVRSAWGQKITKTEHALTILG